MSNPLMVKQAIFDTRMRLWACAHAMQRANDAACPQKKQLELKAADFFYKGFKARRREALALATGRYADPVMNALDDLPSIEPPNKIRLRLMTGEAA